MSYEVIAVLVIVTIGFILFITELVRVDVTSIIIMILLMLSGVLTPGADCLNKIIMKMVLTQEMILLVFPSPKSQ